MRTVSIFKNGNSRTILLPREAAALPPDILASHVGWKVAEHLATVMVWNDAGAGEKS
ncbi:hypothetical protein [Klebsiella aerogenes]|uniref:hypothetical protein n=1 Tax=Klebsiella aerogenes TaxID=548 RepID=UPI0034D1B82E